MSAAAPTYSTPPVERAFALLRHIADGGTCRNISRTAQTLGINRTTLIRLLGTLEAEGMVERIDDEGGYRLGVGLIVLSARALASRDVVGAARPLLARLVDELSLSAHLGVLDGRDIVYLARETPNSHLASMVREGTRLPAHATSIGRILLAQLPDAAVRARYQDDPLERYTDKTACDLDALLAQLDQDRANGMAWSVSNFEAGLGSCACAVFDHAGAAIAGINVTGPDAQFAPDAPSARAIQAAVKQAARDASARLGYRP